MIDTVKNDYRPKYRKVGEVILSMINSGEFVHGQKLPSERKLASDLGVAYLTVRRANEYLERRGILRREHGRGTFIGGVSSLRKTGVVGYLNVSGNENDEDLVWRLREMEKELTPKGFQLRFAAISVDSIPQLPESLLDENVKVVIVDGFLENSMLRGLQACGKPLIIMGNHPSLAGVSCVRLNMISWMEQLVATLVERGHNHIWFVGASPELYYIRELEESYRRAVQKHSIAPELVCLTPKGAKVIQSIEFARQYNAMRPMLGSKQAIMMFVRMPLHGKELLYEGADLKDVEFLNHNIEPLCEELREHSIANISFSAIKSIIIKASQLAVESMQGKKPRVITIEPVLECNNDQFSIHWDC